MKQKSNKNIEKLHHDLKGAIRNVFSILELLQIGALSSSEVKKVTVSANKSRKILEMEIEKYIKMLEFAEKQGEQCEKCHRALRDFLE
jgi:methionyl-tRNA synthetase